MEHLYQRRGFCEIVLFYNQSFQVKFTFLSASEYIGRLDNLCGVGDVCGDGEELENRTYRMVTFGFTGSHQGLICLTVLTEMLWRLGTGLEEGW